jgi:hypothetical protein
MIRHQKQLKNLLLALALGAIASVASAGGEPVAGTTSYREQTSDFTGLPAWFPKLLGMQFNGIYQNVPSFHNPYQGGNSFTTTDGKGRDFTQVYGLYLGSQLLPSLQAYLDMEYFRGNGVGDGVGLSGYINGDVIRAGSSDLSKTPYVARMFLKYTLPLSPLTEKVERSMDQMPGEQAVARWEVKAGKMGAADDFDQNRYANNNRSQFFNFDFLYNTAWDYAADTRGYSYGLFTALVHPAWKLALGAYMEPNTRNGADFDYFHTGELGYNLELTLKPNDAGTVVRLLSYFNQGRMGNYAEALALGRATATAPDLLRVERAGGYKYGFGLNFEQPLTDEGETGIFGRLGWSDGSHESWSYVESDAHGSIGLQVSGMHWGRKDDRLGIAYGVNGLSAQHKDYLKAGGSGILLGDGNLNYGYEQTAEAYYSIQLCPYLQVSPDFQFIRNPGYNKDRGPVEVYGLRVRASF